MRWKTACLLVLLVGCDGTPPLDELPLRDGLRARPDVVEALPAEMRARLAARYVAAAAAGSRLEARAEGSELRAPGSGRDRTEHDVDLVEHVDTPQDAVRALDLARARHGADALVVGTIAGGEGRALVAGVAAAGELPPFENEGASTAALEKRALAGAAGGALRALVTASGARRLARVVGWPVGAVAIGDTIYVNAAWLVALAPEADGGTDAGVEAERGEGSGLATGSRSERAPAPSAHPKASRSTSPVVPIARAFRFEGPDGGADAGRFLEPDAGAPGDEEPPSQPPPSDDSCAVFLDECAASSCSGDGSDDSCSSDDGSDGSTDSCSGSSDDGSADSCSGSDDQSDSCSGGDDGGDACSGGDGADACTPPDGGGSCDVGHRRGRPRGPATYVCMLAPLGFLLARGRR